jgi:1-acyl-sn-glycerol-3-phosphate acyltransferase
MALRNYLNRLECCFRWLWIVLATVASIPYVEMRTLLAPRRVRPELYARHAGLWGKLFLAGICCRLEGAHHIPRDTAVLFASNHQSFFDIPLFHALMPVTFRWMSKSAFFSWPFIGWALRSMKAIRVDPGSPAGARRSWQEAVETLKAGHNLVIFPEGTWGDLEGVIRIARQANVPVVPITIVGSNRVNPPRTKEIHPGTIRMIVHPPMGPDTWRDMSDDEWLGRLRDCIAENLALGAAPADTTRCAGAAALRRQAQPNAPRREN